MMATSADLMSQMQSFDKTAMTPEAALAQQNTALGVDPAQQRVQGLRGAINNTTTLLKQVAPSIMGRTANSLVTNAQATKQIANEQAPIADTLSTQTRDYDTANEDYTNLSSKAERLANAKITGQTNQRSYLQQLYDSLYKGEQDARILAENRRQFDIDQANQTARARLAAAGASPTWNPGGGGSTAAVGTPQQRLTSLIQERIPSNYATKFNAGYTERQIELMKAAFPELAGSVAKQVYDYRKQFERTSSPVAVANKPSIYTTSNYNPYTGGSGGMTR